MLPGALHAPFRVQISQMIQYVFNFIDTEESVLANF